MKKKIIVVFIVVFAVISLLLGFFLGGQEKTKDKDQPTKTIPTTITTGPALTQDQEAINKNVEAELGPELSKDYKVIGHKIYNDWAIASVVPQKVVSDSANVILKKENGAWKIFEGPQTYFDEEELRKKGVPEEIVNLSAVIPLTILEP